MRPGFYERLYEHTVGIDERAHRTLPVDIKVIDIDTLRIRGLDELTSEPKGERFCRREEINDMFDYPKQEYFSTYHSNFLLDVFLQKKVEFFWEPTLPSQSRK